LIDALIATGKVLALTEIEGRLTLLENRNGRSLCAGWASGEAAGSVVPAAGGLDVATPRSGR
jgi:hypothetical protein